VISGISEEDLHIIEQDIMCARNLAIKDRENNLALYRQGLIPEDCYKRCQEAYNRLIDSRNVLLDKLSSIDIGGNANAS
jgi:hypothetical protein